LKSLFLRIFVWFWVVMAVLVGLLVVLSPMWTRVRPSYSRWEQHIYARLAHESEEASNLLQSEGPQRLRETLSHFAPLPNPSLYLLHGSGRDLWQQRVPRAAAELAQRARSAGQPELAREAAVFMVARSVTGPDGTGYMMVISHEFSPHGEKHGLPRAIEILDPGALAPLLGLIALVVGGLSYWLARYLTSPVAVLRAAARRLTGGDLTARVGPEVGSRRDELGELARDFDHMAERLEVLIGSQRRLLRDVSHELRSPLSRLEVALELARQRAGDRAQGPLDRIARESSRINEMIGQLLTLQRLEGTPPGQELETVDLGGMLQEVVADARFEAHTRDRDVHLLAGPPCMVRGSVDPLRSAVENVVRNGLSYTDPGTDVEVSWTVEEGDGEPARALIVVRDHGPGVPDEHLEHLFEPFYRVAEARDRASGGTGLGLAITERAVGLHGGSVAASNHPDGGLVVTLTLLVASEASAS